jgi:hypothetical protein
MKAKQSIFLFLGLTLSSLFSFKSERDKPKYAFQLSYTYDDHSHLGRDTPIGIAYLLDENGKVVDEKVMLSDREKTITLSAKKKGNYSLALLRADNSLGFAFHTKRNIPNHSIWYDPMMYIGKNNKGIESIYSVLLVEHLPSLDSLKLAYPSRRFRPSFDAERQQCRTENILFPFLDFSFLALRATKTSSFRYQLLEKSKTIENGVLNIDFNTMEECKSTTLKFNDVNKAPSSYRIIAKTAQGLCYLTTDYVLESNREWTEKEILLPNLPITDFYIEVSDERINYKNHISRLDIPLPYLNHKVEIKQQVEGTKSYQSTTKEKIMILYGDSMITERDTSKKGDMGTSVTYSVEQYSESGIFYDTFVPEIPKSARKIFEQLKENKKPTKYTTAFIGFKNKEVSFKEYLDYEFRQIDNPNNEIFDTWLYDIGEYWLWHGEQVKVVE